MTVEYHLDPAARGLAADTGALKNQIQTDHPCWEDYSGLLKQLDRRCFPDAAVLNRLLPTGLENLSGRPIRFVPASDIPGVDYEQHIFTTGEVSTREDNWHDLFNALVWCRWPRIKTAMNALHSRHMDARNPGRRGSMRDALTLFDESGAIVFGSDENELDLLAKRCWQGFFRPGGAHRGPSHFVFLIGHALLEKFLAPYKAITAHCVLVLGDRETASLPREVLSGVLDRKVAEGLLDARLFSSPSGLSPLPLAGLRGWWPACPQDQEFYADRSIFRPPPPGLSEPPIFRI